VAYQHGSLINALSTDTIIFGRFVIFWQKEKIFYNKNI